MRNSFFNRLVVIVCPCLLLCFAFSGVSCRITTDSVQSIQGDMTAPELISIQQLNETQMRLQFSETVVVSSVAIYADGNLFCSATVCCDELGDTGTAVSGDESVITMEAIPSIGGRYVLSGSAADKNGNSLTFAIPFSGYNGRVPFLVLSEIRNGYTTGKSEFIELYAATSGNLAGVLLYSAYDDKYEAYEFPAAEVNAGEYVTVHFRLDQDNPAGCIDETGNNLNLSDSKEACRDARDFWVNNSTARLGTSDVISLRERAGGVLLDAILYSESSKTAWKTEAMISAAEEAVTAGVWPDGTGFSEVFCSDGVTSTRTISRQNISEIDIAVQNGTGLPQSNKNCWTVTATKGATPGSPNWLKPN